MREPKEENTVFSELFWIVRDYYAPLMTAPEAARKAVKAMADNGHEAIELGKRTFMVDGELFEIKKVRGWSHFDLWQHGIKI